MKLSHRISFPGGREFEQHECIFELDSEELAGQSSSFDYLNTLQKFQLMNTLLLINGLLFQRAEGYIGKDDYTDRKKRAISLLAAPIKKVLEEVLQFNGSQSE